MIKHAAAIKINMISRNIKLIILFVLFFVISPVLIFAHPHIFIANAFTFVFNDIGLAGLRVKWVFDEMYSASLIMDFDSSRNNIFEENEIAVIEQQAFSNLENYGYFLHINFDNSNSDITSVVEFRAEIVDNRIVYYFFIPLNYNAESVKKTISAGCYDDTYFCYISNSEVNPVKLENNSIFECTWEIIEDKENVYWETIIPKVVV
ncbi:MAG: DUF1007 family protein, partial [Calditrichia bacterium]|nr:DUF1007 family protein [Calditrichia bacterium]